MSDDDFIKGHRMTDLESSIFHGWQDLNCPSKEEIEDATAPYINFQNGNKLRIISYDPAVDTIRGKRAKIIGAQCYDTETKQWVFMELDMTQPIDRYIPEWMFVEWLMKQDDDNEKLL